VSDEEEAVPRSMMGCLLGAGFGNRRGTKGVAARCPEDEEENIIREGTTVMD
jgi:hypothetical protein